MKKAIFISLILVFPFLAFSQIKASRNISYEISKPYRVVDAHHKLYFQKEGELMVVKVVNNTETVIQKMNTDDPKIISSRSFKDLPKGYLFEEVIEIGGKYLFFFSVWDKPNLREQLYYREIDFDKGEFAGKKKLVFKVKDRVTKSIEDFVSIFKMGEISKFNFLPSNDDQRLLIQYRKKPKEKKDTKSHDIIGTYAFDSDMNKLWHKELRMPYTERKMDNIDYAIDGNANAYILAKVFKDDSNRDRKKGKDKSPNYRIELLRLDNQTQEIEKIPIKLKDKFINEVSLFESPNGEMICAGFYNDGTSSQSADGILVLYIDKQGKVVNSVSHEIPLHILNQYESKRTKRKQSKSEEKGKAEFLNLKFSDLTIQDDGSLILIGEQYFKITHYVTTGTRSNSSQTYYHYNDILATKLSADGELVWMQKLPKMQKGKKGKGGMSYKYIKYENNHYLLYLDNIKNFNLPVDKSPALHSDGKGGFLTAYQIEDDSGETKKLSFFDLRDVKGMAVYQFQPSRIINTQEGEFIVEVYKKKKEDVLIKVRLKGE